jgi:hypothetical protein
MNLPNPLLLLFIPCIVAIDVQGSLPLITQCKRVNGSRNLPPRYHFVSTNLVEDISFFRTIFRTSSYSSLVNIANWMAAERGVALLPRTVYYVLIRKIPS